MDVHIAACSYPCHCCDVPQLSGILLKTYEKLVIFGSKKHLKNRHETEKATHKPNIRRHFLELSYYFDFG